MVYTGVTNMTPSIVDLEDFRTLVTGSLTSARGMASPVAVRGNVCTISTYQQLNGHSTDQWTRYCHKFNAVAYSLLCISQCANRNLAGSQTAQTHTKTQSRASATHSAHEGCA